MVEGEVNTEQLSQLSKILNDPIFSNPTRLVIMLILVMRRVVTFSELQKLTGVSPSTLESHLQKLIEEGFIEKKKTLYNLSVRVVIKPTSKGVEKTLEFLRRFRQVLESIELNIC